MQASVARCSPFLSAAAATADLPPRSCTAGREGSSGRSNSGGDLKRGNRPIWLEWDLFLNPHVVERMALRRFGEVDLRLMLDSVRFLRSDVVDARWVARAKLDGRPWEVILEPDHERRRLVVVTAYPVGR
jgi:hypothetical protein